MTKLECLNITSATPCFHSPWAGVYAMLLCIAGVLSCPAVVHNTGSMRVETVSVLGDVGVDTTDCSKALMAPDEKLYCTLSRTLTEQDFIDTAFTIGVTGVSGTPRGVRPLLPLSPVQVQLNNPNVSTALLAVSVTANTTTVIRAGQAVLYTITLVGALRLAQQGSCKKTSSQQAGRCSASGPM